MDIINITNGNENEERMVKIMGGKVIETDSEKLIRTGMQQGIQQGQIHTIIELGREDGLNDEVILNRLKNKGGLSLKEAKMCMETYEERMKSLFY